VNGREKLPNLEDLSYDLVQEEIRKITKYGTSSKGKDEEIFALVGNQRREKRRNLKPNLNPAKGERRKIGQKLNASIIMNKGTMPRSAHRKRQ